MTDNNYIQMLRLGKWLEDFFAVGAEYWRYDKLARAAIKLLDIDFEIKEGKTVASEPASMDYGILNAFKKIVESNMPYSYTNCGFYVNLGHCLACYNKLQAKKVYVNQEFKTRYVFVGNDRSSFFWEVIVYRIFLDFLILGGQDYFGFCEYCGKFFAVQRKGRKKFCSDICRTNNQHKKKEVKDDRQAEQK